MDIRLDRAMPRLFVTIRGQASGDLVARRLSETYLSQPEVTGLDMLFDLTAYQGEVGSRHVETIVAAYLRGNRDPRLPCRTAFVSTDPNFRLWAAAMSYQFNGREHRAFPTFEEAERFLGEPMADRAAFPSA